MSLSAVPFLALLAVSPARAVEVEQGVTPDQREQVRISLINRTPRRPVTLRRLAGAAVGSAASGPVVLGSWEDVCDLPCTVRVTPRTDQLGVGGEGWFAPVRLERFDGRDLRLSVRPGRPGASVAGLVLGSMGLALAMTGATFLMVNRAVESDEELGLGRGWTRAGQAQAYGGLGLSGLGIALTLHGRTIVRQQR